MLSGLEKVADEWRSVGGPTYNDRLQAGYLMAIKRFMDPELRTI